MEVDGVPEVLPQVICRELFDEFSVSNHSRVAGDGRVMQIREPLEYGLTGGEGAWKPMKTS